MLRKKLEKNDSMGLIFNCFCPLNVTKEKSELEFIELKFITDFYFFLFSIDDRIDNCIKNEEDVKKRDNLLDHCIKALRSNRFKNDHCEDLFSKQNVDPHVKYISHLMCELHQITSNQRVIDRFITEMENFFNIGIRQGDDISETPEQYLERRLYDSATFCAAPIIELCATENGSGLSIEEYQTHRSLFEKAERLCSLVLSLVNDLLSYHKDVLLPHDYNVLGGDINLSYLQVLLKHSRGMTLEEASRICLRDIARYRLEFDQLVQQQQQPESSALSHHQFLYIKALERYMDELCTWMCHSKRYRHPDQPFEELRM
nr:unnamed protein product [Naegleria fowleri]